MDNGVTISFWTRTIDPVEYPDRLEVRTSTNGNSSDVGSTETSVGDFTTLLMSMNPTLTMTDSPNSWTQYTLTLSGLAGPTDGRVAFRYYVTDTDVNADSIGIDTLSIDSASAPTPEPASFLFAATGLVGLGFFRRRQRLVTTDRQQ